MPTNYLKQILIGEDLYDFNALAIQDGNGNAKSWADIEAVAAEAGLALVSLNSLPTADAESYAAYRKSLVLVPNTDPATQNIKDEYIIQRDGEEGSYTYRWELIGTTEVDLSGYVTKGTYTTEAGGTTVTGEAGGTGDTPISSEVAVDLDGHTFTPSGSITGDLSVPGHTHDVTETTASAVTNITFTAGSAPTRATFAYVSGASTTATVLTGVTSTTSAAVTEVSATTASVLASATVNNGVLSFNAATVATGVTSTTATVVTGVSGNGTADAIVSLATATAYEITGVGEVASLTYGTADVLAGVTIAEGGSITISSSPLAFVGNEVTLTHTQEGDESTVTLIGEATVNIPNHTHTIASHTHNIDLE